MEGEPHYGNWQMRMSAAERRRMKGKIIRGGKIADEIHLMAQDHHEHQEIPAAERALATGLASTTPQKIPSPPKTNMPKKTSFLQKLFLFFRKLFSF